MMVTTGYLDIIKSSEQYGLVGPNLVQKESARKRGEQRCNILAVPGRILLIILDNLQFQH